MFYMSANTAKRGFRAAYRRPVARCIRHIPCALFRLRQAYLGANMSHCARWTSRLVRLTSTFPAVLVVDDHEASGTALTAALGEDAMDARFAASGIQALELTRNWTPDVVVLDVNMPVHDGFSTARVLRRIPSTRDVAIVAFTALDEREVRKKG